MARPKKDSHKSSYNISTELYEWIVEEADKNCIDINAQVNMMLAKSRYILQKQNELLENEEFLTAAEQESRYGAKRGNGTVAG